MVVDQWLIAYCALCSIGVWGFYVLLWRWGVLGLLFPGGGLPAGTVKWHTDFFATILLHYAPPKAISVLEVFVLFGGLFLVDRYIGRPSSNSLAISVAFPIAVSSLFSLCCVMVVVIANDSEVVDSWYDWACYAIVLDTPLVLFRSSLLQIGTVCIQIESNESCGTLLQLKVHYFLQRNE